MYVYLFVALLSAAIAGVGSWRVQDWRYAAKEKERLEAEAELRRNDAKRIDVAATSHEADRERVRTEFVVITERVHEVLQTDFYAAGNQCLDPDGVRLVNEAAGAAQPASQPAPAVPRHSPTD